MGEDSLEDGTSLRARPDRLVVVFDGNCGFCTRTVNWLRSLDARKQLAFVPCQRAATLQALGLTQAECAEAAWAIEPGGRRHRGAAAVLASLACALDLPPLLGLYYLPIARQIADAIYAAVSASRPRLPGTSPYCQDHPGDCQPGEDR